jgi:hypothetical protein
MAVDGIRADASFSDVGQDDGNLAATTVTTRANLGLDLHVELLF